MKNDGTTNINSSTTLEYLEAVLQLQLYFVFLILITHSHEHLIFVVYGQMFVVLGFYNTSISSSRLIVNSYLNLVKTLE